MRSMLVARLAQLPSSRGGSDRRRRSETSAKRVLAQDVDFRRFPRSQKYVPDRMQLAPKLAKTVRTCSCCAASAVGRSKWGAVRAVSEVQ
jgi:hypothetical protein